MSAQNKDNVVFESEPRGFQNPITAPDTDRDSVQKILDTLSRPQAIQPAYTYERYGGPSFGPSSNEQALPSWKYFSDLYPTTTTKSDVPVVSSTDLRISNVVPQTLNGLSSYKVTSDPVFSYATVPSQEIPKLATTTIQSAPADPSALSSRIDDYISKYLNNAPKAPVTTTTVQYTEAVSPVKNEYNNLRYVDYSPRYLSAEKPIPDRVITADDIAKQYFNPWGPLPSKADQDLVNKYLSTPLTSTLITKTEEKKPEPVVTKVEELKPVQVKSSDKNFTLSPYNLATSSIVGDSKPFVVEAKPVVVETVVETKPVVVETKPVVVEQPKVNIDQVEEDDPYASYRLPYRAIRDPYAFRSPQATTKTFVFETPAQTTTTTTTVPVTTTTTTVPVTTTVNRSTQGPLSTSQVVQPVSGLATSKITGGELYSSGYFGYPYARPTYDYLLKPLVSTTTAPVTTTTTPVTTTVTPITTLPTVVIPDTKASNDRYVSNLATSNIWATPLTTSTWVPEVTPIKSSVIQTAPVTANNSTLNLASKPQVAADDQERFDFDTERLSVDGDRPIVKPVVQEEQHQPEPVAVQETQPTYKQQLTQSASKPVNSKLADSIAKKNHLIQSANKKNVISNLFNRNNQ